MQEIVDQMRTALDSAAHRIGVEDGSAEFAKLNAIRFVENYRIMRSIEQAMMEERK